MITYLNESWDEGIRDCLYNCGPGINSFVMTKVIRHTIKEMVNTCCEIISQTKEVNIKAEFEFDFVNIAELSVYATFNIFNPEEKLKRQLKRKYDDPVTINIKVPSFYKDFNNNPDEWYRETMKVLWTGYKDYMKENYNHI